MPSREYINDTLNLLSISYTEKDISGNIVYFCLTQTGVNFTIIFNLYTNEIQLSKMVLPSNQDIESDGLSKIINECTGLQNIHFITTDASEVFCIAKEFSSDTDFMKICQIRQMLILFLTSAAFFKTKYLELLKNCNY